MEAAASQTFTGVLDYTWVMDSPPSARAAALAERLRAAPPPVTGNPEWDARNRERIEAYGRELERKGHARHRTEARFVVQVGAGDRLRVERYEEGNLVETVGRFQGRVWRHRPGTQEVVVADALPARVEAVPGESFGIHSALRQQESALGTFLNDFLFRTPDGRPSRVRQVKPQAEDRVEALVEAGPEATWTGVFERTMGEWVVRTITGAGGGVAVEAQHEDHRPVGGFLIPHRITWVTRPDGGSEADLVRQSYEVHRFEAVEPPGDDVFAPPSVGAATEREPIRIVRQVGG